MRTLTDLKVLDRFALACHEKPAVDTSPSSFVPEDRDACQACVPPAEVGEAEPVQLGRDAVLSGAAIDPWADARERVRGHLRRACRWRDELLATPGLTVAALAEREAVPAARVSEATSLLRLPTVVLQDLADPASDQPVPTVKALQEVSKLRDPRVQVARFEALRREIGSGGNGRRKNMPRQQGFQHVLAKARQYQAWLDQGVHRSLRSLGAAEGITVSRVGLVLDLLTLAPEILAAIDVPAGRAPKVTHAELRGIAKVKDKEAQLARFDELRGALAAK